MHETPHLPERAPKLRFEGRSVETAQSGMLIIKAVMPIGPPVDPAPIHYGRSIAAAVGTIALVCSIVFFRPFMHTNDEAHRNSGVLVSHGVTSDAQSRVRTAALPARAKTATQIDERTTALNGHGQDRHIATAPTRKADVRGSRSEQLAQGGTIKQPARDDQNRSAQKSVQPQIVTANRATILSDRKIESVRTGPAAQPDTPQAGRAASRTIAGTRDGNATNASAATTESTSRQVGATGAETSSTAADHIIAGSGRHKNVGLKHRAALSSTRQARLIANRQNAMWAKFSPSRNIYSVAAKNAAKANPVIVRASTPANSSHAEIHHVSQAITGQMTSSDENVTEGNACPARMRRLAGHCVFSAPAAEER